MQYFFGGSNVLGEVKSQLGRTPGNPTLFFADSAPLIRFAPSVPFMPVVRSPQGDLCARINDALFIATDRLLPPLLSAAPHTKITKRTDNRSCLQQRSNGPRVQPPCNPRQTKLRNEATKPFHFNETVDNFHNSEPITNPFKPILGKFRQKRPFRGILFI